MPPIIHVGRVGPMKGKRLSDILLNLKNLGKNRVVARNSYLESYPQKTYFRLTKIVPNFIKFEDKFRSFDIWAKAVVRGEDFGEVKLTTEHHPDWKLIPKEEEEIFCKLTEKDIRIRRPPLSEFVSIPPLLNILLKEEMNKKDEDTNELKIKRLKRYDDEELEI